MIRHAWARLALVSVTVLTSVCPLIASVNGFTPSAGYEAEDLALAADCFAVAPDGRLAASKGSTITIYNQADPAGRSALATITSPQIKTLGGMAFQGQDTLLVTDNTFMAGALFSATISTGTVSALAAPGTLNNAAQVRVRPSDGAAFIVQANNPGSGAVLALSGAGLVPFATNLGTGYLGGIAFDDSGSVYVGDTNDPYFVGNPGRILQLNAAGTLVKGTSLADGGGHGIYDIAGNQEAVYATTGGTVTRLAGGSAISLGSFTGAFPFPTDIAVDGSGVLVNGIYTGVGGVFRIRPTTPVPEPSSLALALAGITTLLWKRKRG